MPNLADYSLVSTNLDVICALKEGLKEAQGMLRILNMAPSNYASAVKKLWFLTPWKVEKEGPTHLAYQPVATPQPGVDGDAECERVRLESNDDGVLGSGSASNLNDVLEDEILDNSDICLQALEEETRNVFVEILTDHKVQVPLGTLPRKIVPLVTYEGHSIYKSTLVSQLNGNPYLSKDRLTRMKNSIYFNNSDDYVAAASSTTSMLMGLGSDVGVYFKDERNNVRSSSVRGAGKRKRGRTARIISGVDNGIFCVGRVQKIRVKVGTKWGICRQPLDLMKHAVQNDSRGTVLPTAMVYLHWFKKQPGVNKYKYDESDCIWVDVDAVISTVSLHYSSNTKIYTLDDVDAHSLHEFVFDQR